MSSSGSFIPKARNYFKYIADHKDVTKLTVMLTSAISSTKADTNQCMEVFDDYMFLWKNDREETIQVMSSIRKNDPDSYPLWMFVSLNILLHCLAIHISCIAASDIFFCF